MTELPQDIHQQITEFSQAGEESAENGDFAGALEAYWSAWDLLPEPQMDWEAATWLLASIGNVNFVAGDFEAGRNNLSTVMHCPGALGNPFIHLRLGQCQLELGDQDSAADELARAYMNGGTDIFDEEDPKYFTFLQTVLEPPADGW